LAAIRRAFQRDRREREARRQRQSARDAIMGLGARELQILVGVVQGMQNREMATAYGLSERTINYYRTLLTRGLDIYTSVGLSRLVSEAGMSVEELEAAIAAADG
jgi:FixJ family two-component response regulator